MNARQATSDVPARLPNGRRAFPGQDFPDPPPGAPLVPVQRIVPAAASRSRCSSVAVIYPVGASPGQVGGHLPVAGGEVGQLVGGEAVEPVAGRPVGQVLELVPPGALAGGEGGRGGGAAGGPGGPRAAPAPPVQLQQVLEVGDAGRGGVVGEPRGRSRRRAGPGPAG